MPVINRLRVVNFSYDKGIKSFANNTFRLDGRNTVFNLVNTGGKTVLLHLVLQAVLPGCSLGKRKFENFFTDNKRTSYIMVEWLLDGTERNYLLTGMCVGKSLSEENKLRYFMFVNRYDGESPYDIENIKIFKDDRSLMGYNEFLKMLNDEKDVKVYRKYQRKEYIKSLRTFNILDLEWETIRTINSKEGEVDKFFLRSPTSRLFIENILVPYVEKIICENKEDESSLSDIFRKYAEDLIKIPEFEASIKLYKEFLDGGQLIVGEVRKYSELKRKIEEIIFDIVNCRKYILEKISAEEEKIRKLGKELEDWEDYKTGLLCSKESFGLYLEKISLEEIEKRICGLKLELEKVVNSISNEERKISLAKGKRILEDIGGYERELAEKRSRFESRYKSSEDKLCELNRCLFSLQKSYRKELGENSGRIKSLEEFIDSGNEDIRSIEKKKRELEDLRYSLGSEEGIYLEKIRNFEIFAKDIKYRYGTSEIVFNIDDTISGFKGHIETCRMSISENEKKIEAIKTEVKDIEVKVERVFENITKVKGELAEVRRELSFYDKDFLEVISVLGRYEIREEGLFEDMPLRKLSVKKSECESKLKGKEMELVKLREKELLLEDDFYISDSDILKVESLLSDNGIEVISGSEYLAGIEDEVLREEYIGGCPLLPYGIIIDRDRVDKLNKSDVFNKLELDFPVPLIVREEIREKERELLEVCIPCDNGRVYFINNRGKELYTSKEAFREYRQGIKRRILELEKEIDEVRKYFEEIDDALRAVNGFTGKYVRDFRDTRKVLADEKKRELENLNNDLKYFRDSLEKLGDEKEFLFWENNRLAGEMRETGDKVSELESYVENGDEYKFNLRKKADIERKTGESKVRSGELSERLSGLRAVIDERKRDRDSLLQVRNDLLKKLGDIVLPEGFCQELAGNYSIYELEGLKEGLEVELKDVRGDTIDLEYSIRLLKENIKNFESSLEELNTDRAELLDFIPVADYEIRDMEREVEEFRREERVLEEKLREAEGEKIGKEADIRNGEKSIWDKYKREPVCDFEAVHSDVLRDIALEIETVERELEEVGKVRKECEEFLKLLGEWEKRVSNFMSDRNIEDRDVQVREIDCEDLKEYIEEKISGYNGLSVDLTRQKQNAGDAYGNLFSRFGKCEEKAIFNFISSVSRESEEEELYDIEPVEEVFSRCMEQVKRMKKLCEHNLSEVDGHRDELSRICTRDAEKILVEINSIDSRSALSFSERKNVKMVRIRLGSEERKVNLEKMRLYVERCINELKKEYDESGGDRIKVFSMIDDMMSSLNILGVITDVNRGKVEVFKSQINERLGSYVPWEKVGELSGGEKYTSFFAMYISLLSYIRARKVYKNSSFVILADNPFGTATADHLLKVVFGLVRKYNTQMVCFTAIKETSIYSNFERIHSLILRNTVSGRQRVHSEFVENSMEDGFIGFGSQLSLF